MDISRNAKEAFGIEDPPQGGSLSDALRERVAQALADHMDRQIAKVQPTHNKPVTRDEFFGFAPEKEPKAKRTDYNEIARRWMEARGWLHYRVDHYNAHAGVSQDLFGILDFLAFPADGGTIGVQITSRGQMSARANKINESKWTPTLLSAGWRILVLGFYKGEGGRWIAQERYIG